MSRFRYRHSPLKAIATTAIGCLFTGATAHAAMFVAGADPTTTFSSLLFDEVTPSGGASDSANNVSTLVFAKRLNVPTGTGPLDVTIDGIALNFFTGTAVTEETVSITITYFGDDDNFGASTDNVVFGTRTATVAFDGIDQYTAVFDTPMMGTIGAATNRFRFDLSSTGNLRVKQFSIAESPSGQFGPKLSVGGSFVPEPASLSLLAVGGLLALPRRRRA